MQRDKPRWQSIRVFLAGAAVLCLAESIQAADKEDTPPYNVLFIPIDDLNDWVTHLGGHPQAVTPNLDRLAAEGVTFTNAHCAAPGCNPSRVALLTGLRPSSTGVYFNGNPWRPVLPDVITLPRHFKDNGYFCAGFGKVYHGRYADASDWHIWGKAEGDQRRPAKAKPLSNGGVKGIRFGPLGNADEEMIDYLNVTRTIEQLQQSHERPWFIACGLIKPHMAFSVPQSYFEKFPLETIQLPEVPEDDLQDVPAAGVKMARPQGDHRDIVRSGRWKEAVQAYLATVHFADAQLGRLLDAWENSPREIARSYACGPTMAGTLVKSSTGENLRCGRKPPRRR